ncbi:MAG: YbjN domain-containing protein [Alphaproteobacteria bacterium]|nr:MAG: YbjN domain-containing protein [Alphaproteobacteria bacterium]
MERNPIDTIEDLFNVQEWPTQRPSDGEVIADVVGKWGVYSVHFLWDSEVAILQFIITSDDLLVEKDFLSPAYELCGRVNEKIQVGHFEVISEASVIGFRHGLILPGTRTISEFLLEELINTGIEMCEKFYPAFQFVLSGGRTPSEAASMAMINTIGEA